nr:MAG TPA: hypothetical protein [Caudoviricetes sp.]
MKVRYLHRDMNWLPFTVRLPFFFDYGNLI